MKAIALASIAVGGAFLCVACGSKTDAPAAPDATAAALPTGPATYATLTPFLQAHCFSCHGGGAKKGGLSLATYADFMKGGEDGVVIKPGDPDNSMLIMYLQGKKKPQMPMRATPLSDSDIKVFSDWIKAGAKEQ